jgi:hypothetical protein
VGSPTFDTSRARFGDLIAAGAGLVLFISLFLNWYSVDVKSSVGGFNSTALSESGSGWEALGFIDILLAICALIAIAVAVMRMMGVLPRGLPVTPGQLLLLVGGIATILVLFRILSIPHGDVPDLPGVDISFGREFGIFLALIAAIAMAVGGWLTWGEEGRPAPGQTGTGAAGGGPLGAGQPYGGQPGGAAAQPPVGGQPAAGAQATAAGGPVGGAATSVGGPAAAGGGVGGEPAPPAGGKADWYPDPRGQKRLRYYDGTRWTEHTAD